MERVRLRTESASGGARRLAGAKHQMGGRVWNWVWASLEDRRPAVRPAAAPGRPPRPCRLEGAVHDEEMIERVQFGEQLARSRSAGPEAGRARGLHRPMERVRLRTESASGGARRL